jgi:glycosyltransferase involved in cell wall biosynthesis
MKEKNLIFFYPSFERGGVTKNLINLLNYLKKYNIKVHLISTYNLINDLKLGNNFFYYPVNKNILFKFFPGRFNTAFNAMFVLLAVIKKLKNKKVVIHSMQSNIAAILICLYKRKKIVIRNSEDPLYSAIYSENKFFALIVFILKFLTYNFAHKIITNSLGSKKNLKFFVFNKKKIITIYNPYLKKINKRIFKKDKIVLNIGRLRKQKNQEILVKAFSFFVTRYSDYKLIILGHGNLKNKLQELIIKLDLKDKVFLKGWTNNTIPYLRKAKIFVLSSLYEGLGNVLIDSINLNTPCISTNCNSGPKEILLYGKGGYLVKNNSVADLAEKMIFSVQNYNLSKKKNYLAKKKLNRFFIDKNCRIYIRTLFW